MSPLTLDACRQALAVIEEAGVPPSAVTCFVIPRHEGRLALDEDAATRAWLDEVAGRGADFVMHGFTHRMPGRAWSPRGLVLGHGFARGQGELFRSDAADARRRLEAGAEILRRVGLERALGGFVPPAWLLSRAARDAVRAGGFTFFEVFGGIVRGGDLLARRLIGFGSLSEPEARATALWARLQCGRAAVDTRLAVHPVDVRRPTSLRALRRTLQRLLTSRRPRSYRAFLAETA